MHRSAAVPDPRVVTRAGSRGHASQGRTRRCIHAYMAHVVQHLHRHLIRSAKRYTRHPPVVGCVLRGGWSALFVLRSSCPVASSAASRPRLDGMLSLTYRHSTGKRRGKETINQEW